LLADGIIEAMGTWGAGAFDNDDAADWAFGFDEADLSDGLSIIQETLLPVAEALPTTYLRSYQAVPAVAAAELVAFINGKRIDQSPYNEPARNWVARTHPSPDRHLIRLARRALKHVTRELRAGPTLG
jgi:hypothetical protein